jgi:hypothetical protein
MKHAGRETLATLAPLFAQLRAHKALVERTPGSFYLKSKAYLHFHEDPSGTFADLKIDDDKFTRLRVVTEDERAKLVSLVAAGIARRTR